MSTVTEVAFESFSKPINESYASMVAAAVQNQTELFVIDCEKDMLYRMYLESFPPGTNPIFRTRTEHDCSTCKNFIRNLGGVVSILNGKVKTIWGNLSELQEPYATVAAAMDTYVSSLPIRSIFRSKERQYGVSKTIEAPSDSNDNTPLVWNHFCGIVPERFTSLSVEADQGQAIDIKGVFNRGLSELNTDSCEEVLRLIESNSIYRGQEFQSNITEFLTLKRQFDQLESIRSKELFVWQYFKNKNSRFKNTVIGTLVEDLSNGIELETAVRSFEAKVAPTNYKRPTSLITPKMVADAVKTIAELGLESAIERRFARISDISVNNVLFVDNSVRNKMLNSIELHLQGQTKKPTPKIDNATDVSIDDFINEVLPKATSVDLFVTNSMQGNFMSMTAPVHGDSGGLLKWNNDFAWSYDGNITDSIKQRVKKAGGNVSAKLRTSLAWFNTDDLDIHMFGPNNVHLYFGAYRTAYAALDVDMNAGGYNLVRDPVENISWNSLPNGEYTISVCNFNKRESVDVGFVLEVETEDGNIKTFSHNNPVPHKAMINCLIITIKNGAVTVESINDKLVGGSISQEKWGIKTEELHKVNIVTISPNYWDDNTTGNKHWFFILDGCNNPEPIRGIYNEFLSPSLERHRKVFEILGDKTKCPVTNDQLSGIGFSSTKHDSAVVYVTTAAGNRPYRINF